MSNFEFLFASLDSKRPDTARKVHIRRLYDILQLCIQRRDYDRARRAWAILARCKEIHWKVMWKTAVQLILSESPGDGQDGTRSIEFLRSMMLRYPEEKQSILRELALRLIQAEKYREALEELDLYLPSFPHQDNPVLHAYAGLVALYLSQSERVSQISDAGLLRMAKGHLERSRTLDPDNTVVQAFLDKISTLSQPSGTQIAQEEAHDSEEDVMNIDGDVQPRKRARA